DTVYACIGTPFDLTSSSVVAGSDAGLTYSYYTDALGTVYAYNPDMLTNGDGGSGQYYIKAVNSGGCSGILPVYVKFELPQLTVTNPATVQYPATVDITTTFSHLSNQTYAYLSDSGGNTPIADPTAIHFSGTDYVRITD